MKINKLSLVFSALLFSFSSVALESDYDQAINVSSVSQNAQMKTNTIVFLQDVLLTQGSIKITGDKLTVIRGTLPNHEIMIADGNVATFYQTQSDGKPFDAQANRIHYDIAKGKITLTGNAQVKQLDSQINGSIIEYFLNTKELIVNTGEGEDERVRTVFLPAQFEKEKTEPTEDKTSTQEE
ncbi:MAG: lipopolysaccharide export system protein LptA [Psychromonas sp.]|jgi:lipopolysaccharide export system protein LptA|uniref:lipopolysaccharide transport periplasmic protein LptA n=1 Tax=Psychromonas sp. TaxID=1884585 RepID=UPI0039E436DF